MEATSKFPFTAPQWKELERQAMIYKYMMASLPVPPDLLFPLTTEFSAECSTTSTTSRGVDAYGFCRYPSSTSNSKDSESGRCRRTDGKKWRCSRDVAPNQKYCERHMHRGRPRSRKHVEVQPLVSEINNYNGTISSNKKTRLNNSTLTNSPIGQSNSQQMVETTVQSYGTTNVIPKMNTDLNIRTFASRDVNWVMEDKMMGTEVVGQQWSSFMNNKIDNNPSPFQQQYEGEGLNLLPYTDSSAVRDVNLINDESQFLLLGKQPKGGFIDAWSNDGLTRTTNDTKNGPSLSSRGNISSSTLTLPMAMVAGNVIDEEMENNQGGGCDYGTKDTNFVCNHSWILFGSGGGPLAEVLHTGGGGGTPSNPASPCTGNCDSVSPLSTNVSSPSGVRHRVPFTQSDNSVGNVAFHPVEPTEVAPFQWLK